MKKLLLGCLAVLELAVPAVAADLPARTYTKAPPIMAAVYDWTGFYIGANLGYSWGRSSDTSTLTNGAGTVFFSSADRSNLTGVVGGGQFGYNWQVQNWVWGLEADIQGSGEKGTRNFICPIGVCTPAIIGALPILGPAVPVSLTEKLLWFGTVRGRVGVLATPAVLFYATGGLAYGEVASNISVGPLNSFSPNNTKVGYSVGAGVEGMFARNWTARLEYLYVDLGSVSGSLATTVPALGGGTLVSTYSSRVTDNILRLGVNYKFGGPGIGAY